MDGHALHGWLVIVFTWMAESSSSLQDKPQRLPPLWMMVRLYMDEILLCFFAWMTGRCDALSAWKRLACSYNLLWPFLGLFFLIYFLWLRFVAFQVFS